MIMLNIQVVNNLRIGLHEIAFVVVYKDPRVPITVSHFPLLYNPLSISSPYNVIACLKSNPKTPLFLPPPPGRYLRCGCPNGRFRIIQFLGTR